MKTWCPRCDQGWVRAARHRATGEQVFVCEECEALWAKDQPLTAQQFQDFQSYFQARGQPSTWNDLAILDADL